jgi:regulator of protease activity HflC (stomatin/prohibitin superfamily)
MSKQLSIQPNHLIKKIVIGSIGAIVGLILLSGTFFTVSAGERALVLRFGQVQDIVGDGLHAKLPMVDTLIRVDIRTQKSHAPATAGTRDLQTVTTEVALNYGQPQRHLHPFWARYRRKSDCPTHPRNRQSGDCTLFGRRTAGAPRCGQI